jgi:hypothetical protein
MKECPENIQLCKLQVVCMPNGEILCLGKTIGWFDKIGKYLEIAEEKK